LRNIDVIARYGGEEFVVLLPRTGLVQACDIAERIRATIAGYLIQAVQEKQLKVTISIGVAMLPEKLTEDDASTSHKLLNSADSALYRAKENGRNRVVYEERQPISENIQSLSEMQ
jgi:diguanylate cyclase (GGDEF)-like protein